MLSGVCPTLTRLDDMNTDIHMINIHFDLAAQYAFHNSCEVVFPQSKFRYIAMQIHTINIHSDLASSK